MSFEQTMLKTNFQTVYNIHMVNNSKSSTMSKHPYDTFNQFLPTSNQNLLFLMQHVGRCHVIFLFFLTQAIIFKLKTHKNPN